MCRVFLNAKLEVSTNRILTVRTHRNLFFIIFLKDEFLPQRRRERKEISAPLRLCLKKIRLSGFASKR